jgi:hypothetical protein
MVDRLMGGASGLGQAGGVRLSRSYETNEHGRSSQRWRWIGLALIPGVASDIMFAGHVLFNASRFDALVALGMGLLCGAGLSPLVAPLYLVELGRKYVRAVHGGYQSATPFVLIYGAANFVLWLGGMLFVLSAIGYR